jgi:hypothetical protein
MNEGKRTDRQLSTQRGTQRLPRAGHAIAPGPARKDQRKLARMGRAGAENPAVGMAEPDDAGGALRGGRAPGRDGPAGRGRSIVAAGPARPPSSRASRVPVATGGPVSCRSETAWVSRGGAAGAAGEQAPAVHGRPLPGGPRQMRRAVGDHGPETAGAQ